MKKIMKWQVIEEQRKEKMKKLLLEEQEKAMEAKRIAETANAVKEAINTSTEDDFKMSGLRDMKKYRLPLLHKAERILINVIDKICYIINVVRYQLRNLMENGIAPRSITGHIFVRNYITSTLIKTVTTVAAQNQFVLQSISDDNPKTIDLNTATFVATSPKKINAMNFSLNNLNNHINQHANINLRAYPEYLQMKSRYRRNHLANIERESAKK